jgi:cytochrome P450
MVFTEWETWKRKRRIISSVFHYDFLNEIIPTIREEISLQFNQVDQKISQGASSIDMKKIFSQIMSNVVAKSFFGTDMSEYLIDGKPYCEYYVDFLEEISSFITSWEHVLLRMHGYNFGLTERSRQLKKKNDLLKSIAR